MKSIRFTMSCLMLLACLCFRLDVQAQCQESDWRPFIDVLSVDPVTGHITITWDMPSPENPLCPTPERFVLFWYEETPGGLTNHIFAVIPTPATRSYTFDYDTIKVKNRMPDPRLTSVPFTVAAINGVPPDEISSMRSIPHYNIQVKSKYDSCRAEIRLDWHRYRIWQRNTQPFKPLVAYHVMRIPKGGDKSDAEQISVLQESDTTYIVPGIKENDIYTFFIKAIRSDLVESTSYRTIKETKMPVPPTFITAVGTEYNDKGLAEIGFIIDSAAESYSYEFLGSSNYNYSFVSLGTLDIRKDTVLTDLQTRGRTYYYKLEAWHVCKNKYTASSNMATALWVTLKQEGPLNHLFWNPYVEWGSEAKFDIYRKIGDNFEDVIGTVSYPATPETDVQILQFKDDLSDIYIDGDVCYRIIARPVSPDLSGQQEQAFSNSICIKPESNIFIPKAFTPNVAGINSEFKPFFSYPPEEYLFIIYDRTGAMQFEIKGDSDIGWNGQLKNGKPASEGVYTYVIRYRTAMGRLIEKRGTFSLIMP